MALKNVVVTGCTLTCSQGGTAVISTNPSTTSSIDNCAIYSGPLTIVVAGSSAGGAAANASGSSVLQPTASFVQVDDKFVVLEGDYVEVPVAGSSSSGSPTSGVEVVTIQKAGQEVFQAE